MKPEISIASYSFHGLMRIGAMSLFQYFETVKYRYRLDTADIWNMMLTSYDDKYLKILKMMMDDQGLTLMNLCCDGCHIWGDTSDERAKTQAVAEDCLRAAQILGAKTVRIDLGIREAIATDAQIEYCAGVYDEYCAIAARFDAKLGPENHWGASTNLPELRKLFQAVKAPNFGLLLHLGNWQQSQDNSLEAQIKNDNEFAPKAMHTHVMYEVCEQAETRLPQLLEAGYKGCIGVESHKSTNEYRNVAHQLAQVRRVLFPFNYLDV